MMDKLIQILEEVCPGIDFDQETALIDDGILDSLDIVTITAEIMEAFQIKLNVADLIPENFNSVDQIWALIESKQQ